MESPACPRCKATRASRLKRKDFLQSFIYPLFRLFPWECGGCRKVFMVRDRGPVKRRRHGEPRSYQNPSA